MLTLRRATPDGTTVIFAVLLQESYLRTTTVLRSPILNLLKKLPLESFFKTQFNEVRTEPGNCINPLPPSDTVRKKKHFRESFQANIVTIQKI